MKANRLVVTLLLLLSAAVFQLSAQQNEVDRKLLGGLRAGAEKGDAQFQFEFGCVFDFATIGVSKDELEAVKWYQKAAEQDYAKAQFNLGVCYANGEGVVKDEAEAAKWYLKAANLDDVRAQYNLGCCYLNGVGLVKNETEAVRWYRKAAGNNLSPAQFNLGICYANGKGVVKDEVEAVKWYRKAAEQNLPDAQYNLGAYYDSGGGATNKMEAVKWYRQAAEQNYAPAQYNLGLCYANGDGVEANYLNAAKWFRKAADQNHVSAQHNLGVCYATGKGVMKNEMEAVKWYRKAAEQNHTYAQFNLGICYANGQGVEKDYVQVYKWWQVAAARGHESAKIGIGRLEAAMTPEQIAEGKILARNFKSWEPPSTDSGGFSSRLREKHKGSSGTGFFITEDGYVVTNEHVVKGDVQLMLVTPDGLISAKVVKVDSANDLALLKAEGRFAALPVAASRGVRLGGTVATVGFPNIGLQGFAPKLAKGEIASLSGAGDDARYFQISVPVQPGNSGGALVDERGNVVGVVSAKLNASAALAVSGVLPENVNYAVKSSYLLSFLESVPEMAAKLKEPAAKDKKFEDVVTEAEQAAVLVLVY